MAVAYFQEWTGATRELGKRVSERMNAQTGGAPPEGGIYHAEGESDGAWWTFDVWESENSAQRFYDETLRPVVEELSIPQSQSRVLPVHWHSMEAPS